MAIVKFAHICDICHKRGEEYSAFPSCRECGKDVCPEHSAKDWCDAETNSTICTECAVGEP